MIQLTEEEFSKLVKKLKKLKKEKNELLIAIKKQNKIIKKFNTTFAKGDVR